MSEEFVSNNDVSSVVGDKLPTTENGSELVADNSPKVSSQSLTEDSSVEPSEQRQPLVQQATQESSVALLRRIKQQNEYVNEESFSVLEPLLNGVSGLTKEQITSLAMNVGLGLSRLKHIDSPSEQNPTSLRMPGNKSLGSYASGEYSGYDGTSLNNLYFKALSFGDASKIEKIRVEIQRRDPGARFINK